MGLGERAFKKAIRSREHRERSQPNARAKLGLLEKHKDYALRARDYHRKQDKLKALKIKSRNRNPDEFHFGMIKSRVVGGKHVQDYTEKRKTIPADMLKLMKTQDVSYISLQKNSNMKKLIQAEQELAITESSKNGASGSHIYFADDEDDMKAIISRVKSDEGSSKKGSPLEMEEDEDGGVDNGILADLEDSPQQKYINKKREEIRVRRERVDQLTKLENKLNIDRQLLGKGKRKKIGTDEFGFGKYKWKLERKK